MSYLSIYYYFTLHINFVFFADSALSAIHNEFLQQMNFSCKFNLIGERMIFIIENNSNKWFTGSLMMMIDHQSQTQNAEMI